MLLVTVLIPTAGAGALGEPAQAPLFLSGSVKPNILFFFDNSRSMLYKDPKSGLRTRLEVAKSAVKNLLGSISNARVGIASLSGNINRTTPGSRARLNHPIVDLDANRKSLSIKITGLRSIDRSPVTQAYAEIPRLFIGGKGKNNPGHITDPSCKANGQYSKRLTWPEVRGRKPFSSRVDAAFPGSPAVDGRYYTKGNFESPICHYCQQNAVIMISDGYFSGGKYRGWWAKSSAIRNHFQSPGKLAGHGFPEVAEAMYVTDLRPDINDAAGKPVKNNVVSHTIGYGFNCRSCHLGANLLKHAAEKGGGHFIDAKDAEELSAALQEISGSILGGTGSAAPVSFNYSKFEKDRRLYLPQFNSRDWSGDLRAYQLKRGGIPGELAWSAAAQLEKRSPKERVMLSWRDGKVEKTSLARDECAPVAKSGKEKERGKSSASGIGFRWNNLSPVQQGDLAYKDVSGTASKVVSFQQAWGRPGYGDSLFSGAYGIATDTDGNIYVADNGNHGIQKFDARGRFIARWGKRGPPAKWWDRGTYGKFSYPQWVATDKDNNVYVTESPLHRIQKFDSSGNLLATWGGYGKGPGQFHNPMGIATDSKGYVYVADNRNNRIQKFDSTGTFVWARGEMGKRNGEFFGPMGIAVGPGDIVYVTDWRNHRVQKFASSRAYLGKWGTKGSKENELFYPMGIATDRVGNVYVVDMRNNRVQKFSVDGAFLQSIGRYGSGDGEFKGGLHGVALNYRGRCGEPQVLVTANNRVQRFGSTFAIGPKDRAEARLAYLRGDRSNEGKGHGFRKRKTVLGDIVHSKAVYVAEPPRRNLVEKKHYPKGRHAYSNFMKKYEGRKGVLYVGANDGALHAFNASDGKELFAYLPGNLFSNKKNQGYHYLTDPEYSHRYYVDGTPSVSDAFIKGAGGERWRTVLIGSQRAGGRGLFALDVTVPHAMTEANAKNVVMWEFTNKDDPHLGYTYSKPIIGMMPNGRWAAIVGNGYRDTASDGTGGQAQLFVLFLDGGLDGEWTEGKDYVRIPTGVGSPTDRNGLSTPSAVDTDGDWLVDRVYAGDLWGNMWAFDVSDMNPSKWKKGAGLLFAGDRKQPITTRPSVTKNMKKPRGSAPNLMVMFGTGRYLAPGDGGVTDGQSYYGVWDNGARKLRRRNLTRQRFLLTDEKRGARVIDPDLKINYGLKSGWYVDFPVAGERVVTDSVATGGLVHFNTQITAAKKACEAGGSGWTMSLRIANGGSPIGAAFDFDGDDEISDADTRGFSIGGVMKKTGYAGKKFASDIDIPGGVAINEGRRYMPGTKSKDASEVDQQKIIIPKSLPSGRLSWMELQLAFRGPSLTSDELKAAYDAYVKEETGMNVMGYH